jgi:DNA-binding NarL/FixJ family response regulator
LQTEKGCLFSLDDSLIISPRLPGIMSKKFPNDRHPSGLTARELEIAKLVYEEYGNREISEKLFISESTVNAHKQKMIAKMQAKNIMGVIKKLIRSGFLGKDDTP